MLRTGFIRKPEAVVTLNRAEVELLMKCSKLHYDSSCRAYGSFGGRLFGISNHFHPNPECEPEVGEEGIQVYLTFKDVDILSKITENQLPGEEGATLKMHLFFGTLCRELNEEYQRINSKEYEAYLAKLAEEAQERRDQ